MTVRDLLLVLGAVPLLGVVALRLAAETGLAKSPPPPDALTASLALFGVVFVFYVALTLRAIARARPGKTILLWNTLSTTVPPAPDVPLPEDLRWMTDEPPVA